MLLYKKNSDTLSRFISGTQFSISGLNQFRYRPSFCQYKKPVPDPVFKTRYGIRFCSLLKVSCGRKILSLPCFLVFDVERALYSLFLFWLPPIHYALSVT